MSRRWSSSSASGRSHKLSLLVPTRRARLALRFPGSIGPSVVRCGRRTFAEWDDYPLRDELQRALGSPTAVVIDSDRAAYILGETWQGAARGARDAIFLAVGTGIGAGILVDGRVLRGHADIAGAIGWMALDRPYRERYAGCGCFEGHAFGTGARCGDARAVGGYARLPRCAAHSLA